LIKLRENMGFQNIQTQFAISRIVFLLNLQKKKEAKSFPRLQSFTQIIHPATIALNHHSKNNYCYLVLVTAFKLIQYSIAFHSD
jgi:gentisate 1,2-dioxygenase